MSRAIRTEVGDFNDVRRALSDSESNRLSVDSSIASISAAIVAIQSAVTALQTTTFVSVATGDSPYALAAGVDVVLCDSSSGAIEIDLPAASGNAGRLVTIIRTSTGNNVTIDPNGSEHLDGTDSSFTMTGTGDDDKQIQIICDSTEWWLVTRD